MGYDMYWRDAGEDRWQRDECYFRLNISGMGVTVDAMRERGMVITDVAAPTRADWHAAKTADQIDELLGRMVIERPGIPEWKLYSTNDGWWVRPIEIAGALALLDTSPLRDDTPLEWWDEWLDYLRASIDHDGFEVH